MATGGWTDDTYRLTIAIACIALAVIVLSLVAVVIYLFFKLSKLESTVKSDAAALPARSLKQLQPNEEYAYGYANKGTTPSPKSSRNPIMSQNYGQNQMKRNEPGFFSPENQRNQRDWGRPQFSNYQRQPSNPSDGMHFTEDRMKDNRFYEPIIYNK